MLTKKHYLLPIKGQFQNGFTIKNFGDLIFVHKCNFDYGSLNSSKFDFENTHV